MDDSTGRNTQKPKADFTLGMSSLGDKERAQLGHKLRLAMACIEGSVKPSPGKAMPSDAPAISQRLKSLTQDITSSLADVLELLVRFDELQGWKSSGARHCVSWMNVELGISPQLGWEYLRVGRKLRKLTTTTALFRAGKLAWSKVRLITRVADKDNENILCHAALDASATDVQRICCGYRWDNDDDGDKSDNERALQQWESRSLSWNEASNGSTHIRLTLPPEIAQAFLNSVEHSLSQLEDSDSTISQRRADAAVLMAETSLQFAGREIATADRYQVVVSVEQSELKVDAGQVPATQPKQRPTVKGAGPIARETARRITCDCSVSTNTTQQGEPLDIGRKSRVWPAGMARAIKDRDQHCQWPGCAQIRNLQIHHVKHWADGGKTCVQNGVCVCIGHHLLVHEGGYRIERIDNDTGILDEQFIRQQQAEDITQFDFEKNLRTDRASFNSVRNLSPTRYRFRVVNSDGVDIRDVSIEETLTTQNINDCATDVVDDSTRADDSTRVECAEPHLCQASESYRYESSDLLDESGGWEQSEPWMVGEHRAHYHVHGPVVHHHVYH